MPSALTDGSLALANGSRVAVVGGGPAGAFFTRFLLKSARRLGLELEVDVFEPRDFTTPGPAACNMCGGVVSESLLQKLAAEGIPLPPEVIECRLDSYVLHMDVGRVRIRTPRSERRIAAVYRGGGPIAARESSGASFDGYLLELALAEGARRRPARVERLEIGDGRPRVEASGGIDESFDLVVVATGVNSPFLRQLGTDGLGFRPPRTTKAYISEFVLSRDLVRRYLGSAMHVFLLPIPRLEFAAIIPKKRHVTLCLLGEGIDRPLVEEFLAAPEVRRCLPPLWRVPGRHCRCSPRINVGAAERPYADRLVLVGDCAVTRLYKDGIGAAYRTAKAAAATVLHDGVSAAAFARGYAPVCRAIERDNRLGRALFAFTNQVRSRTRARDALWRVVSREQGGGDNGHRAGRMSSVLWDTFTGSAPYASVLRRSAHPAVAGRLLAETVIGERPLFRWKRTRRKVMDHDPSGMLGRLYHDGEVIYAQGEQRDKIFVVQAGEVEALRREKGHEFCLEVFTDGEFFGEMALFEKGQHSTTARALGNCWVLSIEPAALHRDLQADSSLALQIMEKLARRVKDREAAIVRLGNREARL